MTRVRLFKRGMARWPKNDKRPAQVIESHITVERDADDHAPQREAQIRCGDGELRVFVSGPDGRWILKI